MSCVGSGSIRAQARRRIRYIVFETGVFSPATFSTFCCIETEYSSIEFHLLNTTAKCLKLSWLILKSLLFDNKVSIQFVVLLLYTVEKSYLKLLKLNEQKVSRKSLSSLQVLKCEVMKYPDVYLLHAAGGICWKCNNWLHPRSTNSQRKSVQFSTLLLHLHSHSPTASTDVHLLILATQNTHINVTKGTKIESVLFFSYHREFQISRGVVSQTLIGISLSLPFLIL